MLVFSPEDSEAPEPQTEVAPVTSSSDADVTVTAPISQPFERPIPGGVKSVDSGDVYGDAVDRSDSYGEETYSTGPTDDTGDEENPTEELQRSGEYRSAVQLAQHFASAYGSYSPDASPREWVGTLPAVDPAAQQSLLETAREVWPELKDRNVTSRAKVDVRSIVPVFSQDGGDLIQLSVTTRKAITVEKETRRVSASYAVTLQRDPEASEGWVVTAVS